MDMALSAPTYSTRSISLIMLGAFAGLGLWLLMPFGQGGGSTPGGESSPSQLPSMIRLEGAVQVQTQGDVVTGLVVPVSVRGDEGIDLSSGRLRAETALAETALAVVPATFSIEWQSGNGDSVLDPGETALMHVALPNDSSIHPENPLDLVFVPDVGPTLIIKDVLDRADYYSRQDERNGGLRGSASVARLLTPAVTRPLTALLS